MKCHGVVEKYAVLSRENEREQVASINCSIIRPERSVYTLHTVYLFSKYQQRSYFGHTVVG